MKKACRLLALLFCCLPITCYTSEPVAINIALKVSGKFMQQVLELNSNLHSKSKESFLFNETHIPHVTILQVFIASDKIDDLQVLVSKHLPKKFDLKIKDFSLSGLDKQPNLFLLNVDFQKDLSLVEFQKILIERSKDFRSRNGTRKSFYENSVDPQFIKYVEKFIPEKTGDNFTPHVTVGLAPHKDQKNYVMRPDDVISFDELIIAQIGNYGAARKILKSFSLRMD